MANEMSTVDWIARILVVIGALNWGLVSITSFSEISYDYDLVALLFSSIPILAAVVYLLVGLSGLWELIRLFKK